MGFQFPDEVREYFQTFNGEDFSKYTKLENGGFPWLPGIQELSRLKDIVSFWEEEKDWMEDNEHPGFDYYCNEKISWEYWHEKRIPLAFGEFEDGDILYIDMNPGPNGTIGQLMLRPHGMGHILIDTSIKAALERWISYLENGSWTFSQERRGAIPVSSKGDYPRSANLFALETN